MQLTNFIQDLKLAYLSLKRIPGFVATVVATLSITLGTLICIFNLNHLLITKSFPYPGQDKLMVLDHRIKVEGEINEGSQTPAGMVHWYKYQQSLTSMALIYRGEEVLASHTGQPQLQVGYATPEYFQLLATPMALGRAFGDEEGISSGKNVAVLSHATWQQWFAGREDIIGHTVQMGDKSYQIVGVAAESFQSPQLTDIKSEDLWLSWQDSIQQTQGWGTFTSDMRAIGLLQEAGSLQQAQSELSHLLNQGYHNSDAVFEDETLEAHLLSLKQAITGESQRVALLLLAGAVALLLIAVANVTNLFLSRAAEKRRTLAIQAAMGARTGQLFSSLFAESLLLCACATVLGLLLAGWGFVLLKELAAAELPRLNELGLDGLTLGFSLVTGILLALLFARLCRSMVNYGNLREQLQSSGKGSGLQISRHTRNALVIAQVSLASLLLVGSALVMEQALSVINQPLGFSSENLYTLQLDVGDRYQDRQEQYALSRELKTALQSLPQVEEISRAIAEPIRKGGMRLRLQDENMQWVGTFSVNLVDHHYFELLQLPMRQGRSFLNQADDAEAREMVVSESLARRLAPDGDILGKVFKREADKPMTVVGVVSDYFNPGNTDEDAMERYYLPYFPLNAGFLIRVQAGTALNNQDVLARVKHIDSQLRIEELIKVNQQHQQLIYQHKVVTGLTLGLTLLALLLAGAGIYGVLSYSTQMRRYELGIHMALGANTGKLQSMVMLESLLPVGLGLAGGLGLAMLGYALALQQLSQVIQPNLMVLTLALPLMIATAILACYLPVRRVIVADPVKALRNE